MDIDHHIYRVNEPEDEHTAGWLSISNSASSSTGLDRLLTLFGWLLLNVVPTHSKG
jgi:hypothetical protein